MTLMSELEAKKEKQLEADESLKATVFALLDIDSSGAVSIMEIGQRLGQDLRDRPALQELFPDLMSGKASDLFLIAGGELGHPERVSVSRGNWDEYWEMIDETLRRTKLDQLHQRIINQGQHLSGNHAETTSGWFDYKVAHSKANERIQELMAMDEQDKAALKQFKSDLIETQDALKKSEVDLEGVNLLLESSNLLKLENQNALEESQANLVENQNALEELQANLVENQNALEESEANLLDSQKELSEKVRTLAESGDGGAADKSLAAALKELELDLFESQNELKDTKKALDTANNEIRTLKEGSDTGIALQDAGDLAWKMLEKPQTLLLSSGKNAGGFAKPALNASQLELHTLREQCAVSAHC